MSAHQLPMPSKVARASELIHGSDDDFIINAYVALQHQWPDAGGFAHYRQYLRQHPTQRLQVLNGISTSRRAQRCGTRLVCDLPEDFAWTPEIDDSQRLRHATLELRLTQAVNDAQSMRDMASNLTVAGLSEAVNSVVATSQAGMAAFESRLNELSASVEAVMQALRTTGVPAPRQEPTDNVDAWMAHEIQRLAQRVLALEQARATQAGLAALAREIADLRSRQDELHRFTTVDLKREVADYVNAFSSIMHAGDAVNETLPRLSSVAYG